MILSAKKNRYCQSEQKLLRQKSKALKLTTITKYIESQDLKVIIVRLVMLASSTVWTAHDI